MSIDFGLKGLEDEVEDTFRRIRGPYGLDWSALRTRMRESGRYHVEIY